MRRTKSLLLFALVTPLFLGCSYKPNLPRKENDDDLLATKRSYAFNNLTDEYVIPTSSFELYFPEAYEAPYISLYDFIYGLNGLFDCSEKMSYSSDSHQVTYTYEYKENVNYSMSVNWYDNTIRLSSLDFRSVITVDTDSTDYSEHFKLDNAYGTKDNAVTLNLDAYYFDIYNYQDKCLVPLSIINIVLGAPNYYNVIFNGDAIYGYFGELTTSDPDYSSIYTSSFNNTRSSSSLRNETFNSLCFTMDYFYGLKKNKGFSSFGNYVNFFTKNNILSTDPRTYLNGYLSSLITQIDDLHTRVDTGSIYGNTSITPSISYSMLSTHWTTFYQTRATLSSLAKQRFSEEVIPDVRYSNNTAIINFTSFVTGTHDQIYDEHDNVRPDAWEHDTYWFIKHALDEIVSHGDIDNVIFDISCNGGGNIGAMIRALGLITNQRIRYTLYDSLADRGEIYYYKVDANNDGNYDDDDAYTQFNYGLLTSESSFSAANTFASIFKELNIGKTFGHRSGGGMCSVLPLVLADSTFIAISSNNTIRHYEEGLLGTPKFIEIEDGISVDTYLDYSVFYNDETLSNTMNQLFPSDN